MAIDVGAVYQKYGPMVLRRCRFLLKDETRARDAMQDVFVNLLKGRDELSDEYPGSLLYRIATNVCLNIIRDKKNECDVDENIQLISKLPDPEQSSMAGRLLIKLFSKVPASTRTMATMHYIDEMTYEEIALEVGLSVPAIKKRFKNLKLTIRNSREHNELFTS